MNRITLTDKDIDGISITLPTGEVITLRNKIKSLQHPIEGRIVLESDSASKQ